MHPKIIITTQELCLNTLLIVLNIISSKSIRTVILHVFHLHAFPNSSKTTVTNFIQNSWPCLASLVRPYLRLGLIYLLFPLDVFYIHAR